MSIDVFDKEIRPNKKINISSLHQRVSFVVLVYVYLFQLFIESSWYKNKIAKSVRLEKFLDKLTSSMDKRDESISRRELIYIALRNLKTHLSRTLVTIGGMMVSVAVIVFLLSIGFGLQQTVINRIADLKELKQTDVLPQAGKDKVITDETILDIEKFAGVEKVFPLISVVAKINFNQSEIDLAAYGVTSDYLKSSTIQTTKGNFFENNDTKYDFKKEVNPDEITYEIGDESRPIEFSLKPDIWSKVYSSPKLGASVLGYVRNTGRYVKGVEVWGQSYVENLTQRVDGYSLEGDELALWLKADLPLWKLEDDKYVEIKENNEQVKEVGYLTKTVAIEKLSQSESEIKRVGQKWVEIFADEQAINVADNLVDLPQKDRQLLLNQSSLAILAVEESDILNKQIKIKLIATEGFASNDDRQVLESDWLSYTVVGITNDSQSPLIYMPFIDLRELTINNYSQLRVVSQTENQLESIRKQIEGMGLMTSSAVDTVNSVKSLFSTIRVVLSIVGLVTLIVAGLGMFNTLTVSLLERGKEVGAMKAMGMVSEEVYEMFMVESLLMGVLGGLSGTILGFILGKIIEVLVSIFAISKKMGYIKMVSMPPTMILFIIGLSLLVSFVTGYYPAKRAKTISALNAIRYE
jgi:ABC-type antimicrobial peptide transport system permease subunit